MIFSEGKYSHLKCSSKNIEVQWLSLSIPNIREIIVVNLYRPPQGKVKQFCDYLNISLASLNPNSKKEIYIMGDSNIDCLDKKSDDYKELNSITTSLFFFQFIDKATRYSNKEKCIDLIFSNSAYINSSGVLDWNYSDHQAIFITRKKKSFRHHKINFIGRCYKDYNKDDF